MSEKMILFYEEYCRLIIIQEILIFDKTDSNLWIE